MSHMEFALSLVVALLTFLAFALTLATILLGNDKTKTAAVELFKSFVRRPMTPPTLPKDAGDDAKNRPAEVTHTGEEKV
jgi:hypothetical protein